MPKKYFSRFILLISFTFILHACSSDLLAFVLRAEIIDRIELSDEQIPYIDQLIADLQPAIKETLITAAGNRVLWKELIRSKKDLKSKTLLAFPEKYIRIYQEHKIAVASSFATLYNQLTPTQRKKIATMLLEYRYNKQKKTRSRFQKKDIPSITKQSRHIFITQIGIKDHSLQMQKLDEFVDATQNIATPAFELNAKQRTMLVDTFDHQQNIKDDFVITLADPYVAFFDIHKQKIADLFINFYNSLNEQQRENFAENLESMRQQFRNIRS